MAALGLASADGLVDPAGDRMRAEASKEIAGDRIQGELSKEKADVFRKQIEAAEKEASESMGQGLALHRIMVGAKAEGHAHEQVMKRLSGEEAHLVQERDGLSRKLKDLMEPRLAVLQRRVTSKRQAMVKADMDIQRIDRVRSRSKARALATIADRKKSLHVLEATEQAILVAEEKERLAKKFYEKARWRVGEDIEAYKNAQTRLQASHTKLKLKEKQVTQAEGSVDRTATIFKAERQRIEQASQRGEAKLRRRMERAKLQVEKSRSKFRLAQEKLEAWRVKQKKLAERVATLKKQYEGHAKVAEEKLRKVVRADADKKGEVAMAKSDWNPKYNKDWAWSGEGELDADALNADAVMKDAA